MEVFCNFLSKNLIKNLIKNLKFKDCPWKGQLQDLNNHINYCVFGQIKFQENLQNFIKR
jgi:hypothetical protein